jgi:hypothetical protein
VEVLPAAVLAQLEAVVGDDDNRCWACRRFITGPAAAVVVLIDGEDRLVRLAHGGCMTSGVHPTPGLTEAFLEWERHGKDYATGTALGVRESDPRALVFLEPGVLVGAAHADPLEPFAVAFGLSPIAGAVEAIDPPATDSSTIVATEVGLEIRTQAGVDTVPATEEEVAWWLDAAAGRAIVVVARGLGLCLDEPTIEEALALHPAWGGVASVAAGDRS